MFKIGEFSKLTMISIKMLRHYDEIGLLAPETVDSFTGYRYYSARQLEAAGKIQALKSMGFGLATGDPRAVRQCGKPSPLPGGTPLPDAGGIAGPRRPARDPRKHHRTIGKGR